MQKKKIFRITTVPESLDKLLDGQLKYVNSFYDVIAISSPGKKLIEVAKKESIRCIPLTLTRRVTPFHDLYAIVKLFFIILRERPVIVHTHTPKAGMVGMIASFLARVPCRIHTVAGLPLVERRGLIRRILLFIEMLTAKCATLVLPNSHGLLKIMLQEGICNVGKAKVLGYGSSNGINCDFFNPDNVDIKEKENLKKSFNIRQNDLVFVFIGRVVKDKGINELIRSFNRLEKVFSHIKLIIVGDFEHELDPIDVDTFEILKSSSCIIHVGFKNDVRAYLSISNALVHPSYREGFPNVVLQALAMNIPCLVSDINGNNEIIINDNNGLVYPVKDENALYQCMKSVIEDEGKLTKMKAEARFSIIGKYEQKRIWQLILNEYDDALRKLNNSVD